MRDAESTILTADEKEGLWHERQPSDVTNVMKNRTIPVTVARMTIRAKVAAAVRPVVLLPPIVVAKSRLGMKRGAL